MSVFKRANFGVDNSIPNAQLREPPVEITILRAELAKPEHEDIYRAAIAGDTFEECVGIIAAELGIIMDGDYDVPQLCDVLIRALRNRNSKILTPDQLDPRLKPLSQGSDPTAPVKSIFDT